MISRTFVLRAPTSAAVEPHVLTLVPYVSLAEAFAAVGSVEVTTSLAAAQLLA